MRIMADKYEQLARLSADPVERRRFGEYDKLYRDMEAHFAEAEALSVHGSEATDARQPWHAGNTQQDRRIHRS